jgi:hypothetical protein
MAPSCLLVLELLVPLILSACATKPISPPVPVTLAVWPFDDYSVGTSPWGADVSSSLTEAAMEVVFKDPALRLVERSELEAILRGLALGGGELAEEATRLRVGRMLGARWMLFGAWQWPAFTGQGRVDVRLVEVESSKPLAIEGWDVSDERTDLTKETQEAVSRMVDEALGR